MKNKKEKNETAWRLNGKTDFTVYHKKEINK